MSSGAVQRVRFPSNDFRFAVAHTANMADERNYLRQWREFRKMSQDELAIAADTTKGVISLLENEKRPLSSKWLRKFAEVLDTQPGYILDLDPTEMDPEIFEAWQKVDKKDRAQVLRILSTFRTGTHD
jgi:transcriptional regulator with XRE-family HTH domain